MGETSHLFLASASLCLKADSREGSACSTTDYLPSEFYIPMYGFHQD